MDLISKYLGEGLDEVLGRGSAHVLKAGNKKNELIKRLKDKKIKFTKDSGGDVVVGDDDFDEAEEIMARMGIF